ncbi:MAG: NAD(P)H:quinone oxidoreductase [bacterium]|nr:NAD(P)H:quinone oxidoreductase [bacterium]
MKFTKKVAQNVLLKQEVRNPKILVLFYSLYGHMLPMAEAVAKGVEISGGEVIFRQVDEVIPKKKWTTAMKQAKKQMSKIAIADPYDDLKDIDGVIVGGPVRYGTISTQMKAFWDQTSQAWSEGVLNGKPAGVFGSTATQHGGNEVGLITMIVTLLHHGCYIVGLPFSEKTNSAGLRVVDEVSGGSPYGPTTITGPMGERSPSQNELSLARLLGETVTTAAKKLMF